MSESDIPDGQADETTGSAEEIAAQREIVAGLKVTAFATKDRAAMRAWRVGNMKLARLIRKKHNPGKPRNMKLATATVAERIARRAALEAAGIVEDYARVLRAGVNVYGKIASQELADYLRDRLARGDPSEKRWAAAQLIEVYNQSLKLLEINREKAKRRQAIATWPSEGEKS